MTRLFPAGGDGQEVAGKPYDTWAAATTGPYGYGTKSAPWVEGATTAEQLALLNENNPPPAGITTETGLFADRIIIDAEYLNINGLIQSGRDNYNLMLGDEIADQIAEIESATSACPPTAP